MIETLTNNEKEIIEWLREAKPYEAITVQKDANGKPDYYIMKREQKKYLTSKLK